MKMVSLLELAERCEAAEGPDRELDAEICCVGPLADHDYVLGATPSAKRPGMVTRHFDGGTWGTLVAPDYTASLDAAMTLFPEGYFPVLDADPRGIEVEVQCLTDETDNGLGACVATGGKTIALALCAAALRARDAQRTHSLNVVKEMGS
jgi:hypothetical protein